MSWSWKRPCTMREDGDECPFGETGCYETADTDDMTPPPGEGWVLDGKFAVGKVTGAGDSPSRSSR